MDERTRQRKERAIWDKQAGGYDGRTLRIFEEAYAASVERTAARLEPGDRILEIGCGTGIVTLGVAPYVDEVIGTDISPEMIEVAQRKAEDRGIENASFRVADGYHLRFDDGSFDAVMIFNTLHVVKEPDALLQEARRLLKPSGILATATDCYAEPVPFRVRLMLTAQAILKRLGVIPFMWYYTQEELRQRIEGGGFAVEETAVLHPAPVNFFILAQKAG